MLEGDWSWGGLVSREIPNMLVGCRRWSCRAHADTGEGADDRTAGPEEAGGQERGQRIPHNWRAVKSVGTVGIGRLVEVVPGG